MRFKIIYDALEKRRAVSPGFSLNDRSYWRHDSYMAHVRPLYLIVEDPSADLRIWVSKESCKFQIATAKLSLNINSRAYHESFRYWTNIGTQAAVAEILGKLFGTADLDKAS